MVEVSKGRVQGRLRLGWMVFGDLGQQRNNSGGTKDCTKDCTKDWKEWRALVHM